MRVNEYLIFLGKGAVQGLTEFLPISSSGHLVLYDYFFHPGKTNDTPEDIFVDILFHIGTLLATCLVFRDALSKSVSSVLRPSTWKTQESLLWRMILLSLIPTGMIGLLIEKNLLGYIRHPFWVGLFLILNGFILWSTRRSEVAQESALTWKIALCIGAIQGIAALPGISRSGSTISCALWLLLPRKTAGEFSFLISIPAIAGAILLQSLKIQPSTIVWGPALLGTFSSFCFGVLFLRGLLRFIQKGKLFYFSFYCWIVGPLAIAFCYYF